MTCPLFIAFRLAVSAPRPPVLLWAALLLLLVLFVAAILVGFEVFQVFAGFVVPCSALLILQDFVRRRDRLEFVLVSAGTLIWVVLIAELVVLIFDCVFRDFLFQIEVFVVVMRLIEVLVLLSTPAVECGPRDLVHLLLVSEVLSERALLPGE